MDPWRKPEWVGASRESAAHFSRRDDPTAVGSRNRFPLPSASSVPSAVTPRSGSETGRVGLSRKEAQETQKKTGPLNSPRPDRPIRTTLQKTGCSSVAWAVSAHPRPDRPIRTTLQKTSCSSVVWAVSAHPRPITRVDGSGLQPSSRPSDLEHPSTGCASLWYRLQLASPCLESSGSGGSADEHGSLLLELQ